MSIIDEMLNARNSNSNKTNPVRDTYTYVKSNGGDPKSAFFNLCKERGINVPQSNDPNVILQTLCSQMGLNPQNIVNSFLGGR